MRTYHKQVKKTETWCSSVTQTRSRMFINNHHEQYVECILSYEQDRPLYIIFIQQQQQRYDNDSPTQSSPMSSSEISSSASYTLLSAQNEQGPLPAFIRTSKTHPHTKSLRKCDPVSR